MIEPEIAFADLADDMDLAEAMVKSVIAYVLEQCPAELAFFNQFFDKGLLERLNAHFRIALYYYNPNISPEKEFRHRVEEQKRLVREMPLAEDLTVAEGPYEPERFYELVRGHEDDSEGGERCGVCFEMRLRSTAEYAKRIGADYFTTTLSISPLKDEQRLNAIGKALSEEYGVKYLYSDFKKRDGYRRSCALSEEYGLYRQDFCGCAFSRMERDRRKAAPDGEN